MFALKDIHYRHIVMNGSIRKAQTEYELLKIYINHGIL